MKKNSKALLLVLCAVALVVASALGTIAYLTDNEAVTNTFTVGQVGLSLDEAKVTEDGVKDGDARVTKNEYHLVPGCTYIKDPTIHVAADSEDCYLFVKVENGISAIETTEEGKSIADQMKALGWKEVEPGLYVFAKEEKFEKYAISKGGDVVVFNEFTIDGDTVDNTKIAEYAGKQIVVTAYAVQAAGFEDYTPAKIWEATFGK